MREPAEDRQRSSDVGVRRTCHRGLRDVLRGLQGQRVRADRRRPPFTFGSAFPAHFTYLRYFSLHKKLQY